MVSAVTGAAIGAAAAGKITGSARKRAENMSEKHLELFRMMAQWVKVKQEGRNLSEYFQKMGYEKAAIYGMSYAGEALLDELRNTDIKVAYGIDKNADAILMDIEVVSLEDDLEPVDVIIVTAVTYYEEIRKELAGKVGCPIVSLEDVLYEVSV